MEFEWDDAKASSNLKKHGISFVQSRQVFDDPRKVDDLDNFLEYGEERWIVTGMSGLRLLTVVYTMRQGFIRIISARKATKHEEQDYYQQTRS